MIFPVVVTVYTDRPFTVIRKTPTASVLLLRAAGIVKGSAEPNSNKVGKVTKRQVEEITKIKLVDLNTTNIESAVRTADSIFDVLRSTNLILAISSTCLFVTFPTLLLFGSADPFTMPAARSSNTEAVGVLRIT